MSNAKSCPSSQTLWFLWGLDLIADGLVLIFAAGTWYLLATHITGKKLFMQNIALDV